MIDKKKKRRPSPAKSTGVGVALKGVSARHGAAVNEWLAAYDGVNYEAGFTPRARMQKCFKSIAKSKVSKNPKVAETNKNQQAGFSAEVYEATAERVDAIVRGKRPHILRMDDAGQKGQRHSNDQLIDIVQVDDKGNPIAGTGCQMKYVGSDAGKCLKKTAR